MSKRYLKRANKNGSPFVLSLAREEKARSIVMAFLVQHKLLSVGEDVSTDNIFLRASGALNMGLWGGPSDKWYQLANAIYSRKKLARLKKRRLAKSTVLSKAFFNGTAWYKLRYQALVRDGAHCRCCGTAQGPMHVDHIKPRSTHPHLALTLNNLQVLCQSCNLGKGNWDSTDWRQKR